ncbi:hypothetical protein ACJJTC_019469 [Scirpophaga incertulas]
MACATQGNAPQVAGVERREQTRDGAAVGARGVCATMCVRACDADRLGSALGWALRGGGGGVGGGGGGAGGGGGGGGRVVAALAGKAAHLALRRYVRDGSLRAADVLLTAGHALLLCEPLLVLGKYCEFHRLYKSKEFKKAAKLLVSLLTSKIAPDYFWDTLLLDTLPLLESDEPVFSAEDTYEIMLCMELKSSTLSGEKAEMLRLALVRNLTRASLMDDSSDEK